MSLKDKIIFGLMIILVAGGGYVQYSYTESVKRMEVLESEQLIHVDNVNQEFRSDLKTLDLQFIGRGKHVNNNRLGIEANAQLIDDVTDSLASLIDEVKFQLQEFDRVTKKRFVDVDGSIDDLSDEFSIQKRRNDRDHKDIDDDVTDLKNRLDELDLLPIIVKDKAKLAEDQNK